MNTANHLRTTAAKECTASLKALLNQLEVLNRLASELKALIPIVVADATTCTSESEAERT